MSSRPTIEKRLSDLETWKEEIGDLKSIADDVRAILGLVERLKRLFNRWSIVVVTALVTSGVVGGPLGKFLSAVLAQITPR